MKNQTSAYIKITIAMCIVGSSVVVGKVMVETIPVFIASELRFLVAAAILVPLLIHKEGVPSLNYKDLLILFLQSLTGVFLFSIFMLFGLKLTTAMNAGIITSTLPAFTAILGGVFLREILTRNTISGVVLAVIGVVILNLIGISSKEPSIFLLIGNLFIIGAVLCEALFIILGKYILHKVSPLAVSTIVSVFGVILFLPFAVYETIIYNFTFLTMKQWGYILYFGVVVTVIAFILMYQGINHVPANKAGVLTSAIPISSVLLSVIFLNEVLTYLHFIGVLFVFLAIYITTKE